ncbi:hypothetical protein L6452_13988 [Arctium lappa]|uniref:Uncharacterized protein n=1 Tax=Arctium lappa TaxID=4217 RepID=A0ACB9CJV1_ARCLA|nr:hypothetical protein L6452_13988 [Arctium lappa]
MRLFRLTKVSSVVGLVKVLVEFCWLACLSFVFMCRVQRNSFGLSSSLLYVYKHLFASYVFKFVIVELSEETLVDTIKIANFEHHSSDLKEFELLGSSASPTQTFEQLWHWVLLYI